MFSSIFSANFGRIKVKYTRITITHVCYIALTRHVPWEMFEHSAYWVVFKQLPRDAANVNA